MQHLTANETYYRRVVTVLGIGLLFFLMFLVLISGAVAALPGILALLPVSAFSAKVIYQLTYGALYLAAFLLPIPIMRGFLKLAHLPWQPTRSRTPAFRYLPLIVLGGITLILAQSYLNAGLVSVFRLDDLFENMLPSTDGKLSDSDLVLSCIVLAVVPAFCEEFLFRGAVLTNLLPFGRGTAILVSALTFSLMHQNLAQFLYAFGAGILLGYLYEKTGSIWNGVILHLCNNAFSLLETVLPQRLGEAAGSTVLLLLDAALLLFGLLSVIILAVQASEKPDVSEGAFGRSLPEADGYVRYPVAPRRSVRLLIVSPYGVYLIACAVTALLTVLMLGVLGSLS